MHGVLPKSWGAPGSFPQLQILGLSSNRLAGNLPPAWGRYDSLPSLRELIVEGNALHGSLPVFWGLFGGFQKLETLGVTSNRLSGPLPDSWASPGAFPALKSIFCSLNMLTGTLPVSWGVNGSLPALQSIAMDGNHLEGTLPGGWGSDGGFSKLEHLDLWKNRLYGPLPQSWGRNGTFPKLQVLYLDENGLNGTLPESWGMPGAFPLLLTLYLGYNRLSGTLPAKWGADSGFAAMQNLDLTQNMLTGSLPKAWVQGENMPALIALDLSMNPLKGELPPVNNPALALLNLKSTSVTVSNESSGFWQSRSPLLLLELSNTKVAGSLPESLNFGGKLQVLHVDNTSLKGTLPFAWLGPNKTLSSLIFGGQSLWDTSASSSDWRKKVCLDEDIYQYDVVARSQVVADSVNKQLQQSILRSPNVDALLNNLLEWVPNSTDSIYAICHNRDAPVVIACLWGSFLALVAVIIIAYVVAGRPQRTGVEGRACPIACSGPLLCSSRCTVRFWCLPAAAYSACSVSECIVWLISSKLRSS